MSLLRSYGFLKWILLPTFRSFRSLAEPLIRQPRRQLGAIKPASLLILSQLFQDRKIFQRRDIAGDFSARRDLAQKATHDFS